ncbi:MAG: family 20 glycosylhydrolase [Bacteroidetes bacterium]|nr:family 20 glycosylhydrolase [Bacteroidota bacterium]
MRKSICFLVSVFFLGHILAQSGDKGISIIPEPVSLKTVAGVYKLPSNIVIDAKGNKEVDYTARLLAKQLALATGHKVSVNNSASASIRLLLNKTSNPIIGDEGYTLDVRPTHIIIKANKPAGLFYGVQTLLQLMPKEIEGKAAAKNVAWQLPLVSVTDYPRFQWRGLMFDVARHFFTKEQVKDFIDQMVKYKFNLLHMHLTDDEGWRIEIKSLPKLTSVGAWNVKRVGYFGTFAPPAADEPRDYGGFYTQDDIRELVQYAKERFVNILPEIDVPGHSLAAVASYPELSCTPGAENYKVRSGEEIMDWSHPGGPVALLDNTLCPANDKVYEFLDKVLTEVAQLFPFEYIHMGGDECPKNFWEKSDAIKVLMQKEGIKTMEGMQSYFEKKVEKIVESKGKKFMGWDEILEGGLAPNAVVMSWRGMKGGIEAAKMGHGVVMSPTNFAYLDYMQSDDMVEPHVYATLRLKTAYEFEPLPDGVDPKFIIGGQGNLWSEQLYNVRHMQYMLWPRGQALAECLWSPKDKKNWDWFAKKTEKNFERMDEGQVKYSRALFDQIFTAKKDAKDSLQILLSTEVNGLDIYYTFDNSQPDNFFPKYESPLSVPKEAVMLKVITYRNGKPIGRQIDMPINELRKRAGLKIYGIPKNE